MKTSAKTEMASASNETPPPPNRPKRSYVWNHFKTIEGDPVHVVCQQCDEPRAQLNYKGGSTSAMINHLRVKHKIGPDSHVGASSQLQAQPLPLESMDGVVARLASQDNIPFNTIASSSVIRPLVLKYTGENVPYSPNTIRKITMRAAALTRSEIRDKLERYQLTGGSFSIAFDEATARNAPHRYISLSVFAQAPEEQQEELCRAFHLGLIQVSGSVTADVVADAVEDRLLNFGVSMRSCYFACTDAASTMINAVAKLGLSSQLCFVHGLHNALAEVSRIEAFRNVSCPSESEDSRTEEDDEAEESDDDSDDDLDDDLDDEDTDDDVDESSSADDENEMAMDAETASDSGTSSASDPFPTVKEAMANLRTILKFIKKSGPRRDQLRQLTAKPQYNGKSLSIKLDVRIRWYSTITMLERALLILPAINAVLAENDEEQIGRAAKIQLQNILKVLQPFKVAMKCLCSAKATLVHADRVFVVLFDNLLRLNTDYSLALRSAAIKYIKKRRSKFSTLLQYLVDPQYDFEVEKLLGLPRLTEKTLTDLILEILRRDSNSDVGGGVNTVEEEEAPQEPAPLSFETIFSTPLRAPTRIVKDSEPTVAKVRLEMKKHEAKNGLGELLKSCLSKLLTVQPSSVEPEREFSRMNHVCTSSRNSLSPKTLDSLVVLRSSLRNEK